MFFRRSFYILDKIVSRLLFFPFGPSTCRLCCQKLLFLAMLVVLASRLICPRNESWMICLQILAIRITICAHIYAVPKKITYLHILLKCFYVFLSCQANSMDREKYCFFHQKISCCHRNTTICIDVILKWILYAKWVGFGIFLGKKCFYNKFSVRCNFFTVE